MADQIVEAASTGADSRPASPETTVTRPLWLLLLSCLMLGVVTDLLFYGRGLGINYFLFWAIFYSIYFAHLKSGPVKGPLYGHAFLVVILGFAATFAWHTNVPLLILNFLAIPILVVAHTIVAAGANHFPWYDLRFILDLLEGIFGRTLFYIAVPFRMIGAVLSRRFEKKRFETAKKVLTGLAVALPLLLVVILLLANADAVFKHYLGRLPELISRIEPGEAFWRTILILVVAVISFAYCYSFRLKVVAKMPPVGPLQLKRRWDPLTVSTFLAVLNLVYFFFVIIQFSYLFGGSRLALPAGYTYAAYARQGFFELLGVTIINFTVFTLAINFTAGNGRPLYKVVRFLLTLLSAFTLVMLVSAFFRLSLYEQAYGFTYARITAHAFMIYLFILFLAALYRVWQERFSLLKAFVIVTTAAYLVFNYCGIDRIIAAANIGRYFETGKIDVLYLTRLSDDAVPQLVRLLDAADGEIARFIENDLYYRKQRLLRQSWPSFNRSRYQAGLILQQYTLQPHEWDSVPNRG